MTGASVVRSSGGRYHWGERTLSGEWMSVTEAAAALEVSTRTVQRSLADEVQRGEEWGAEGAGWRYKPLSRRGIYQLRRSAVLKKAGRPEA